MGIKDKLLNIQQELKAPKNQRNKFGGYNYRSCEDILEAVKPMLKSNNCILTISDELVNIGERYYIKATATLTDAETEEHIRNTAYAREADSKKGMDESQVTGACSSYARKYALNGLFCIDDVKDADATNTNEKEQESDTKSDKKASPKQIELINKLVDDEKIPAMLEYYKVDSVEALTMAQASEIIAKKKGGETKK
jgi:hypothetical protein